VAGRAVSEMGRARSISKTPLREHLQTIHPHECQGKNLAMDSLSCAIFCLGRSFMCHIRQRLNLISSRERFGPHGGHPSRRKSPHVPKPRIRGKSEHLETFHDLVLDSRGQNLALTLLCVPYLLERVGLHEGHIPFPISLSRAKWFGGLLSERKGQNLALTVVVVPYSLDSVSSESP
jgi:hypothetical protein